MPFSTRICLRFIFALMILTAPVLQLMVLECVTAGKGSGLDGLLLYLYYEIPIWLSCTLVFLIEISRRETLQTAGPQTAVLMLASMSAIAPVVTALICPVPEELGLLLLLSMSATGLVWGFLGGAAYWYSGSGHGAAQRTSSI